MILRLVERRSGPGPTGSDGVAGEGRLELLQEMAGAIGRPDWTVDLVLVDDPAMARLNEDFRRTPGVTDVLSFAYFQTAGEGPPDLEQGQGQAFRDLWLDRLGAEPENGGPDREVAVGEVVLAPGFVAARCRKNGWPLDQEIPLLVVHGLLHLLGWEHGTPEETAAMQAVEQDILAARGLPHPLLKRS